MSNLSFRIAGARLSVPLFPSVRLTPKRAVVAGIALFGATMAISAGLVAPLASDAQDALDRVAQMQKPMQFVQKQSALVGADVASVEGLIATVEKSLASEEGFLK